MEKTTKKETFELKKALAKSRGGNEIKPFQGQNFTSFKDGKIQSY